MIPFKKNVLYSVLALIVTFFLLLLNWGIPVWVLCVFYVPMSFSSLIVFAVVLNSGEAEMELQYAYNLNESKY